MKKFLWLIIPIILFISFHFLIEIFALSSVAKIIILTEAGHKEPINVYYSSIISKNNFSEKRSLSSSWVTDKDIATHVVHPNNRVVRGLRIDPLINEGEVKIYSIEILSHFGDAIFFDAEHIHQDFLARNAASLKQVGNSVVLSSAGTDPQMVLKHPVRFKNPLFSLILPVFLSLVATLVVKNINIKRIPAIKDITTKKPSAAHNITSLDGLRGFAALLVIADHTDYIYFKGLGAIGVWIFFCLSGFLLSIPFVKKPSLITSS